MLLQLLLLRFVCIVVAAVAVCSAASAAAAAAAEMEATEGDPLVVGAPGAASRGEVEAEGPPAGALGSQRRRGAPNRAW